MDRNDSRAAYYEKLKDPRWQQVRLRVFERDEWTCQLCGRKDRTLHVHHVRYEDGEPWATRPELLFTACVDCHEFEHVAHRGQLNDLLALLGEAGVRTSAELSLITSGARNYLGKSADREPQTVADAIAKSVAESRWIKLEIIKLGTWYGDSGWTGSGEVQ